MHKVPTCRFPKGAGYAYGIFEGIGVKRVGTIALAACLALAAVAVFLSLGRPGQAGPNRPDPGSPRDEAVPIQEEWGDVERVDIGRPMPSAGYEVTVDAIHVGKAPRSVPPVDEDDFSKRDRVALDPSGRFLDDRLYVEVSVTIRNDSVEKDDTQPLLTGCILAYGPERRDAPETAAELRTTDLIDMDAVVHSTALDLPVGQKVTGTLGYILTEEELSEGGVYFCPDFTGSALISQKDVPSDLRVKAYWVPIPKDWSK